MINNISSSSHIAQAVQTDTLSLESVHMTVRRNNLRKYTSTQKYSNINANNKQKNFSVMPKVNKIDTVKTTEKPKLKATEKKNFVSPRKKIIINVYRIKM